MTSAARDLILGSSLFDQAWYELVAGSRFGSRQQAVEHYLDQVDRRWSPHPLFEAVWLFPKQGWRKSSGDPLSHYLSTDARFVRSPHPLLDLDRVRAAAPAPPDAGPDLGPVDRWLRVATPGTPVPVPDGAAPLSWGALRRTLESAEAGEVAHPAAPVTAYDGRISVVLPVHGAPGNTVGWIRSLFREHPGTDLEVLVMITGARDHRALATAVASAAPAARVVPLPPETTWAEAANAGLGLASGATVVFLDAAAEPTYWTWLEALRRRLTGQDVATAQPLLLAADRTIVAAGASFVTGRLDGTLLLQGHAAPDAARLPDGVIPAVAEVLACATGVAQTIGGFGAALPKGQAVVDLSLRARRGGHGGAAVVPEAVLLLRDEARFDLAGPAVTSDAPSAPELATASLAAWDAAGYQVTPETEELRVTPIPLASITERPLRLRWTIDTAAPGGPRGPLWGDWHFARSLATALEGQGQHVTVDPRESHERATRDLDDVVLVIRGLDRVRPRPAATHLLWVISHPDQVTGAECAPYDLVFAASAEWAADRSRAWQLPVAPLLQCTDPRRFHPDGEVEGSGPGVVFVGNAREEIRPAVAAALEAGCDLALYGADWRGRVPDGVLRADNVPNTELGALYASAGVVLNDHWPDMRRAGFISNRVFDAVACGARVATDAVAGMLELFPGSVREFSTPEELAALATPPYAGFGDLTHRLRNAERAMAEHSFDHRAEQLVEAVTALRSS